MQLRVLGPLEIVDDNATTIPVRGAQLRRALATLSLHAPESTPVDVLNDVLWPDGAPSSNALQAVISKLRKTIAPISIDSLGSAYSLGWAAPSWTPTDSRNWSPPAARLPPTDATRRRWPNSTPPWRCGGIDRSKMLPTCRSGRLLPHDCSRCVKRR